MKSIRSLLLLASLALATAALAAPPVVSNVRGVQRAGTKLVDVTYDLADADTAALTVALQVSTDAGATWTVPVAGSTGHLGAGVSRGTAKQIVWNAGANWNNQFTSTMRFRILADDGTFPVPIVFSLIPAGAFQMGDQSNPRVGSSDELPVHTVTVGAFYMAKTETPYAQWQATYSYATANGYAFDNTGEGTGMDHPVCTVCWNDVVKWCNAKSQQDGLQPCYTVSGATYKSETGQGEPVCDFTQNGYRLPTEAEWEKAARGDIVGKNFPWGLDTITHSQANYFSSATFSYDISATRGYHPAYGNGSTPYTSPAGAFAANGYGLFDMTGNMWEWCWDRYGITYYASSAAVDPRGPFVGGCRVRRGGSFASTSNHCRMGSRSSSAESDINCDVGFRLAHSLDSAPSMPLNGDSPNTTVDTRALLNGSLLVTVTDGVTGSRISGATVTYGASPLTTAADGTVSSTGLFPAAIRW